MKQSCLDTAFYCQDLKTKLTHDLKKSLHSKSNYENIKSTKLYHKYLNETISLLADRVLDSRQELKGYFKNQVMKLQREQRIMEETEAANKLKEKLIAEENGMSTKEEVDRYLKANKLFGADKEDNGNQNIEPHNPSSPRSAISSTPNSKLTPKPPSLMPNSSLSPRPGNLVGMTAAARRKIRGTQSTAMNLDDICEELLQVCQLDGKRYRLETLKKMLQGHVMYQLCFLTLVQSDLLKINQQHQTTPQTDLPPPPPYPPSLQQDISNNSDRSALGNEGNPIVVGTIPSTVPQGTVPKSKKLGIRHVYLKDNLRMCDEDDSEDENVSRKIQYVSTGLTYAQSVG